MFQILNREADKRINIRINSGAEQGSLHIKKTPCITARCHFAFWFNGFFSKRRRGDLIQGLPCGKLLTNRPSKLGRLLPSSLVCLGWHSAASFCFPGLPARRSLISLGKPLESAPWLVSTLLHGYISLRHAVWATSLLNELRGGTTSLEDLRLRSPLGSTPRFKAFPAVYRAPEPFLAPPGYEFPRSSRMGLGIATATHSSPVLGFTSERTLAVSLRILPSNIQVSLSTMVGAGIFGFDHSLSAGLGVFLPS